jgi:hypothetical protein
VNGDPKTIRDVRMLRDRFFKGTPSFDTGVYDKEEDGERRLFFGFRV